MTSLDVLSKVYLIQCIMHEDNYNFSPINW